MFSSNQKFSGLISPGNLVSVGVNPAYTLAILVIVYQRHHTSCWASWHLAHSGTYFHIFLNLLESVLAHSSTDYSNSIWSVCQSRFWMMLSATTLENWHTKFPKTRSSGTRCDGARRTPLRLTLRLPPETPPPTYLHLRT